MPSIYIVMLYLHGDKEKRAYIEGVYDNMMDAEICLEASEIWQNEKYFGEIIQARIGGGYDEVHIVKAMHS